MGLHNPGAVLAVWFALGAGDIGGVHQVLGLHASRVLGVASNHQINAFDRPGQLDIARRLAAAQTVGIVPHVGGCNHHISLGAQLWHHFGSLGLGAAEFNVFDILGHHHFVGVFGGQAHDTDAQAVNREHLVGVKHALAVFVDVGCEHGELGQIALHSEHQEGLVEFMVADRHGLKAQQVHAQKIGYRVLQVALWNAHVDVAAGQQQGVATAGSNVAADGIDHCFLR